MRAVLCDILGLIGRDHVSELGSFVHDERWYLVRNVANILGRLQSPEAVTHLERATGHPEYRVRREAADALARLGTEAAQELLVRLLGDPDRRIQMKAVQALDAWGARRAMSKVLAILMARDPLHRHYDLKAAVLEALERLAAKEALPVLRRLARNPLALGQRSRELRTLARRAVAAIEGQAPPDAGKRAPSVQASWGSGSHG
jgi:HEAT repeat protein